MTVRVEDFGLVGPAYVAPMILQAAEECINWYVEVADIDSGKMPFALLGTPGLNVVLSRAMSPTQVEETLSGPVRGLHVLPGGTQALMVVGSAVLVVTGTNVVTQGLRLTAKQVGTITTNQGPVSISDNGVATGSSPAVVDSLGITITPAQLGAGGYAVIVDGAAGYYYSLSGENRNAQFYAVVTADQTNNTGTLTVTSDLQGDPGNIPTGLVITPGLVLSVPGLPASDPLVFQPGTTITSIDTTANTIQVTPAPNPSVLTVPTNPVGPIQVTIPPFGQITDPAFVQLGPSDHVDFFEGWLTFNKIGTRLFFTNAPTPYTLTFNGLFYALADNGSDNLISLMINQGELFLLTAYRIEVWYNGGGSQFPWLRLPGVSPQIGCSAPFSLARMGLNLVWLARNEQGENMIMEQAGYAAQRISSHAVEHAITSYPQVSDALAYTYEEEGHVFYVITFPSADVTWVYDDTSSQKFGHPCWHKRASVDQNGQFHRHRSNCYMNLLNTRIVGDCQNGTLMQMSRQFYTDAGAPIRALRRSRHIWAPTARTRLFLTQLQLEFTPGVGTSTGQGVIPRAMLRWSSDGGFTWSREYWSTIGKMGHTRNRCIYRQLGYAWDRVFEVSFTDPVPRDIVGCTLYAEPEAAAIEEQ